ncbi:alpha/beta fold hydrolase [Agitococcus lubricus]|uniref:Polyhydroxyalkanoate synthase n=1 Tax=Agitococcus lubricus TaxID=1077255 RepID=A0A2T5IZU5_9GAMM|nr:alpha/beta fold hydrolase [Agitococcus lubricus]PTQ89519.1 polyhydroxyalkanoate synthase [Agitococcus lubricus]
MTTNKFEQATRFAKTSAAFMKNAVQRRVNKQNYILADKTENDVIFRDGIMSVKYYRPLSCDTLILESGQSLHVRRRRFAIPLVMVPPLGVFAWIFDLLADRSLIRYFLAHGFEVYLIDWGKPTIENADLSLENYAIDWFPKALAAIREHSGSDEVSLMGYCMGGLLALMYLASHPEDDKVTNLITIASPIDMHKANPLGLVSQVLAMPASLIRRKTTFRLDNLNADGFHVDGKTLSWLFKMTNPLGVVSSYMELIRNLADDDYVARYMTMNEWFTNMPDYPGATVQDMMRKMGLYNRMAKGQFKIGERLADFKAIHSNLLAFAGDNDKIVSIAGARAIMSIVSSTDKTFHIVPGGHAGVFTGSKAVHTTWSIAKDWLQLRSKPYPRPVKNP